MTPDANTIASILGTVATGGLAAWAARSAKRTKPQEKRDNFTVVTDRMEKEIGRQGKRIGELESESEEQRNRLTGQDFTIRYLTSWVRSLYSYIRKTGAEPPAPPQPVPDEVRQYLHDIGV